MAQAQVPVTAVLRGRRGRPGLQKAKPTPSPDIGTANLAACFYTKVCRTAGRLYQFPSPEKELGKRQLSGLHLLRVGEGLPSCSRAHLRHTLHGLTVAIDISPAIQYSRRYQR